MEGLRERFLKVYANTPLNLRDDIILVYESKPITWNVAYLEIKAKSEESEKILLELESLKFI